MPTSRQSSTAIAESTALTTGTTAKEPGRGAPEDSVGTLASELIPVAARGEAPRVYADANIPSGVVAFMRTRLGWDVFFVMEHDELRRARDIEHYRLARQLGRTLLTQDRDYERDADFPPAEGAGVIVFIAPDERRLCELLTRADRELFRSHGAPPMPLEGRKMRWHIGAAEIIAGPDPARASPS